MAASSDFASVQEQLRDQRVENSQLQSSNADLASELQQLQAQFNAIARDKERADENRAQEYAAMCSETQALERALSDIIDSNISLQSDINVYRRLLEIQPELPGPAQRPPSPLPAPPPEQAITEVRTMTVQKSSQGHYAKHDSLLSRPSLLSSGPVAIAQADPNGDFILFENTGSANQQLGGWTIRRTIDSEPDIVFQFPEGYALGAGLRVRVLSRKGRANTTNIRDSITANNIPTWGLGEVIETRLFDENNAPKAYYKQSYL